MQVGKLITEGEGVQGYRGWSVARSKCSLSFIAPSDLAGALRSEGEAL